LENSALKGIRTHQHDDGDDDDDDGDNDTMIRYWVI